MEFQTLDMLQYEYDQNELSFDDYYALGRKIKINTEEMEQNYDYKPLRELRFLPTSPTKQ